MEIQISEREKQALRQVIDVYMEDERYLCELMLKSAEQSPIPENYNDGTHNFYHLVVLKNLLERLENKK